MTTPIDLREAQLIDRVRARLVGLSFDTARVGMIVTLRKSNALGVIIRSDPNILGVAWQKHIGGEPLDTTLFSEYAWDIVERGGMRIVWD